MKLLDLLKFIMELLGITCRTNSLLVEELKLNPEMDINITFLLAQEIL
tara:strand:- start:893 stop:1036 length:144 start_codon:yes stop_codon:yes gene_type:complete